LRRTLGLAYIQDARTCEDSVYERAWRALRCPAAHHNSTAYWLKRP
jgi:hypothetical protein